MELSSFMGPLLLKPKEAGGVLLTGKTITGFVMQGLPRLLTPSRVSTPKPKRGQSEQQKTFKLPYRSCQMMVQIMKAPCIGATGSSGS